MKQPCLGFSLGPAESSRGDAPVPLEVTWDLLPSSGDPAPSVLPHGKALQKPNGNPDVSVGFSSHPLGIQREFTSVRQLHRRVPSPCGDRRLFNPL